MSRPISNKEFQIHLSCQCGYNEVYSETMAIPYKRFKQANASRNTDATTGKKFFVIKQEVETCFNCKPE